MKAFFHRIPFYPLLIGVYPVLFLWAANYNQTLGFAALRSLLVSLGITLLVCLASLVLLRKPYKAAALAGLALFLFFTYGQFYTLVDGQSLFGFMFGRHRYVLPLWGLLFAIGAFFILRAKSDFHNLTVTANLIGSILVLMVSVQIVAYTLSAARQETSTPPRATPAPQAAASTADTVGASSAGETPDVYYIVLDSYDRQDLLEQDIHLDNSAFITQMEGLGFIFPDCTQSNYTTTVTSMAATLNMDYLDQLGVSIPKLARAVNADPTGMVQYHTKHNLVMDTFRQAGYKIITLKSIWPFIDYPDSDIVYDVQSATGALQKAESYNFQYVFMMTTLMRVVVEDTEARPAKYEHVPPPIMQLINPRYDKAVLFYEQNKYQLSKLEEVAGVPGKKFLYAHLIVTHMPFTFTPDGGLRTDPAETKQGYADQVTYADQRILTIVKDILSQSKTPPVIVVQADHGYAFNFHKNKDVFKILNAYYLPQGGSQKLYPTITPVNTFRLIFSYYFHLDYPLLPDQSIWLNAAFPGGYQIAADSCVH